MSDSKTLTIIGAMHAMDGSGFYRFYVPFAYLGEASHHIVGLAQPGQPIFQDIREAESVDVLVLQRPASKAGVRQMEQIAGKTRIVYETDDDLLDADSSALPHLMDPKMKESIRRCMRLGDMVSVSTPYLAEKVKEVVGDSVPVVVLPNVVDEALLKRSTQWKAELDPDRRLKVGWAGGTSHLADLLAYDTALQNVLRSNDHIDMHFAGHDLSPILRDQRKRATWSPWLANVGDHYKVVSTFDIAVAPLDMNISFNRSKSNLRCLESAACGIPVVATDLEPYHDFVIDGKTGFLVKTQEEFEDRLNALKVTATGEVRDADGNLISSEPIETTVNVTAEQARQLGLSTDGDQHGDRV
jgi:glycosyltransferase involved in cell wall biosynthesis